MTSIKAVIYDVDGTLINSEPVHVAAWDDALKQNGHQLADLSGDFIKAMAGKKPIVYMMLGVPGSGKTTFSKQLQSKLDLPRFAIDEEYSRLGGDLRDYRWNKELAEQAGDYIRQQTRTLVAEGQSVILDLCPWVRERRDEYRQFIVSIGASCHIYYFDVDKAELLRRLDVRNRSGEDYHIVTPEMLDAFIEEFDKPLDEEVEQVV